MIALRSQAQYVPGLPKYLRIISPQGICTSEGYKNTFIAHFNDEHDFYAGLNLIEEKPGLQKSKPVDRFYVKCDPKNNLPTHEATLANKKQKEVKALASAVCVTNEANQKSTLHRKSYSDINLDLDILSSNMFNG